MTRHPLASQAASLAVKAVLPDRTLRRIFRGAFALVAKKWRARGDSNSRHSA
jgi:hypothetical protein